MDGLSGRSARIQELANLKLKGELRSDEFQTCVVELLDYRFEPSIDEDWLNSITREPKEKTAKCDYCTVIAGAIGVAGLAVTLLFVGLVAAHQHPEFAIRKTQAPVSSEPLNTSTRLPVLVSHNPKFAAEDKSSNGSTIAKEST